MASDKGEVVTEYRDVVVVGGGISGLTAAWYLRGHDVVVLEASERLGGRIYSIPREGTWLNFGAHVYGGTGSATDRLLREINVPAVPIGGELAACAFRGRLVRGRIETYPFRLPLSLGSRIALMRAGLRLRYDVGRYSDVLKMRPGESPEERQAQVFRFMDDQTFSRRLGHLPAEIDAMFRCTIARSTGDPEDVSAGYGVGMFHNALSASPGIFSHGIVGGPSVLTNRLASLVPNTETGAEVESVEQVGNGVRVVVRTTKGIRAIEAAAAIVTTQAWVTARIVRGLPPDTHDALNKVCYGPFAIGAFLVDSTKPLPWDGVYAIATPERSFQMLFNTSIIQHQPAAKRPKHGSVMVYAAASEGARLLEEDDDTIARRFRDDLYAAFPGASRSVQDVVIHRWARGSTYPHVGRGRLVPALTRPLGRVYLTGDYQGTKYVETCVQRAESIASSIRALLNQQDGPDTSARDPRVTFHAQSS